MDNIISKIAEKQLFDYRQKNPGSCFANTEFSLDVNTAYILQDKITKLRLNDGEKIIGYKVGCTGSGTKEQFGIDGPIRGTLFDTEQLKNGTSLSLENFCRLSIEGEMAIKIDTDGGIHSVFPVIELHNFIFRGAQKTLSELIGNNGINAGIILPQKEFLNSRIYLNNIANLYININNNTVGNAELWPLPGGPYASLNWLKKNLNQYNLKLLPGHIVLAGTAAGLYPVKKGDRIEVYINDNLAVYCNIF